MKKLFGLFGAFALSLVLISWISRTYSAEEYIQIVERGEHGMIQEKVFDKTSFHMALRPPSYLALKEIENDDISRVEWNEKIMDYSQSHHYSFRIQNDEGGELLNNWVDGLSDYQQLIQYLAFDIKNDFRLLTPTDTLDCQFIHFERNFDLAPFAQIQVGFNTPGKLNPIDNSDEWVVEFDAAQFGLGPLRFRFENNRVISNPNISI